MLLLPTLGALRTLRLPLRLLANRLPPCVADAQWLIILAAAAAAASAAAAAAASITGILQFTALASHLQNSSGRSSCIMGMAGLQQVCRAAHARTKVVRLPTTQPQALAIYPAHRWLGRGAMLVCGPTA